MTTTPEPNHLNLEELIVALEAADPARVVPIGFHRPHSYRGFYEDLAFEITHNITVGDMLAATQSALGTTYQGYKGGDYEMREHTPCWLVLEQRCVGESIGEVFLSLLLATATEV